MTALAKRKVTLSVAFLFVCAGTTFALSNSVAIAFLGPFLLAPPCLILFWFFCPHCKRLAFMDGRGVLHPNIVGKCRNCGNEY